MSPARLLATWFGVGYATIAPGTWGSLAALPFAALIAWLAGPWALVPAAAVLFLLGCWASDRVSRESRASDPQYVVVDEVVGQWLTLAVAPLDPLAYGLGFLLFRIADILKPWPAGWADREVKGGLGIMLDDVLAAIYSAGLLWLAVHYLGV
ncbi:MAG TPA: phosphatidylglycerophosphatase A [Aliidongia sp.]|nr:phosphatidylglycerophosphatase A [Aliidongia sp.]